MIGWPLFLWWVLQPRAISCSPRSRQCRIRTNPQTTWQRTVNYRPDHDSYSLVNETPFSIPLHTPLIRKAFTNSNIFRWKSMSPLLPGCDRAYPDGRREPIVEPGDGGYRLGEDASLVVRRENTCAMYSQVVSDASSYSHWVLSGCPSPGRPQHQPAARSCV